MTIFALPLNGHPGGGGESLFGTSAIRFLQKSLVHSPFDFSQGRDECRTLCSWSYLPLWERQGRGDSNSSLLSVEFRVTDDGLLCTAARTS
ncbi:hypothetical protein AVEN_70196-1 [Araneus ventricosus]|uniref:Uncharacterized protein n=1 Tax=Araneus ventricosus TaxID=182803 RepID=A0A4Y2FDJ6_ARAVE|nr:hypothetical protein AVEN_70196-1 [Araneus ventricosus]